MDIHMESDIKVVIIRMRGVPAMDISALRSLKNIHNVCKKRGITLVLSHVQEQPKSMMGEGWICGRSWGREFLCQY